MASRAGASVAEQLVGLVGHRSLGVVEQLELSADPLKALGEGCAQGGFGGLMGERDEVSEQPLGFVIERRRHEVFSWGESGVRYLPLKQAEQNDVPSGSCAAVCSPGSDR